MAAEERETMGVGGTRWTAVGLALIALSAPAGVFAQANLRASALASDDLGFPGQTYPADVTVQNAGSARAADFSVCLVLSDNIVISLATDLILAQSAPLSIDAGGEAQVAFTPFLPADLPFGRWYVAAVVDCFADVDESDETDNIFRRPERITVRDVAPDFRPVSFDAGDRAAAGETLPLSVRLQNGGNADGATLVRVVLSANPGITAMDFTVFETASTVMVSAGEAVSVSGWGSVDPTLPSGRYYLGAIADPLDSTDELSEDNNVRSLGPIDVLGAGLAIISPALPNATVDSTYSVRFDALGGFEAYEWTLAWQGASPTGLSFDPSNAELAGTPSMAGAFDARLEVRSGPLVAGRDVRLLIYPPSIPLTVLSSSLPPAQARLSYDVQLVAAGGQPPYVWTAAAGLPAGLRLSRDGILGGEPLTSGAAVFAVIATDAAGEQASTSLALRIVDPAARLSIQTNGLPEAVVGEPYIAQVTAEGGQPPYDWAVDALPASLQLNADVGAQLTGTPTVAGEYPIMIEVRDQGALIDRNAYVLRVRPEGALTVLTGEPDQPALPVGRIGEPYQDTAGAAAQLRAAPAGDSLTWSITVGRLPAGLMLRPDGVIEGTPTESGAFAFSVLVANGVNDVGRSTLAMLIEGPTAEAPEDSCGCRTTGANAGHEFAWGLLIALWWLRRRR